MTRTALPLASTLLTGVALTETYSLAPTAFIRSSEASFSDRVQQSSQALSLGAVPSPSNGSPSICAHLLAPPGSGHTGMPCSFFYGGGNQRNPPSFPTPRTSRR